VVIRIDIGRTRNLACGITQLAEPFAECSKAGSGKRTHLHVRWTEEGCGPVCGIFDTMAVSRDGLWRVLESCVASAGCSLNECSEAIWRILSVALLPDGQATF